MKLHYKFRPNVNIHDPGTDPGARFYAWVWHKHFKDQSSVANRDMYSSLNLELAAYHAHVTSPTMHYETQFSFSDEHNLTLFLLTWS
jgi:hypothetical protein